MSQRATTAVIVIAALALVLAAPRGSAQADVPTHDVGDKVGYGTTIDIDEALQPAIAFLEQEDERNDNFTINELSMDGVTDIWATTEVVDESADAYSIQTNSAFGLKLQYVINVTVQDLPAAGTYDGNRSRGCFPDSIPTEELTFSADVDISYLLASTGIGSWTTAEFALEEDETNSSLELRTITTYYNAPYYELDPDACELTLGYRSASYETNAEIGLDMRTVYDPALDVFAFPIQDGEVWAANSTVTQGGKIRGTVDVTGLTDEEEQELFTQLNEGLESLGFSVSGLDGFPIDLENVTLLVGTTPYLKDGVIHDQSNPLGLSLEAREIDMTLADGEFHTVYLISESTGDVPMPYGPVCSAVYSPDDGFIVGYRCDVAGATVFELPNVPWETADEHIADTKRDYTLNPTGTGTDFLGNFFLQPPFFGILLIAAVAILVAALLVRRRRKPALAPPGAMPPMPPQAPPPGPP